MQTGLSPVDMKKAINIKLNQRGGEEVDDDAREITKGTYVMTSTQDEPHWVINDYIIIIQSIEP